MFTYKKHVLCCLEADKLYYIVQFGQIPSTDHVLDDDPIFHQTCYSDDI